MIWAFYDSVLKKPTVCTKFERPTTSLKIWLWRDHDYVINLKPILNTSRRTPTRTQNLVFPRLLIKGLVRAGGHFCLPLRTMRWSEVESRTRGQGHKKIQSQGQPFWGQTLLRPSTGMLEAKDQGHRRKCSPKKKKVFKKFFQAISKKKINKIFFRRSTKF